MKRFSALLIVLCATQAWAGEDTENTGALWTEVGVTKALPYNLSIDASLEHRTIDWFDWSSRYSVSAGLSYKLNKHLKFALGYSFIEKHFQEDTNYKYKNIEDNYSTYQGESVTDADGAVHTYSGYNVTSPYWIARHRVAFDISGTMRFRKTFRISLRERYQYTRQPSKTVDRVKYRKSIDANTGEVVYEPKSDEWEDNYKVKSAKNRHVLRSRLKLSIDKKGWKWEPYVSVEAHNDLASSMHLDKVRTMAGVDYSINRQHKVGIGYVFNHENDDDGNQNIHAVSIGYNFKF